MIEKTEILKSLKWLETRYKKSKSPRASLLYSKLAIIEICGWLEVTMDDVVKRCAKRCLKEKNHLKYIQETIIQKTHGFSYNDHFRKMLISIIGLTNFEKMEKNSDPKKLSDFCASLSYLVPNRNSEAHTYLKGTTKKIDAPSQTIGHFIKLHVGIHEIEKWLKANGF